MHTVTRYQEACQYRAALHEPGKGEMGRGGVFSPERGSVSSADRLRRQAPGVVGLAGGVAIPTGNVTSGAGVFGQGSVGVRGTGQLTAAFSKALCPRNFDLFRMTCDFQLLASRASSPRELIGGLPAALPKNGLSGDLIALNQPVAADEPTLLTCSLWLCVRGEVKKRSCGLGAGPSRTNGRWASITRPTKPPGPRSVRPNRAAIATNDSPSSRILTIDWLRSTFGKLSAFKVLSVILNSS